MQTVAPARNPGVRGWLRCSVLSLLPAVCERPFGLEDRLDRVGHLTEPPVGIGLRSRMVRIGGRIDSWQQPLSILTARFAKVVLQLNF